MGDVAERYKNLNLSDEALTEEVIADMFADWSAGRMKIGGIIRGAFERLKALIKAIAASLRQAGYRTVDDIFGGIEQGHVGRRSRAPEATVDEGKHSLAGQDPRPETPDTVENRQEAMQSFFAKGQPLDRAMRLPFDWFGGVDKKGQWEPGAKLFDAASEKIKTARFNPEGRFAWMNGPLEAARVGLIDRYGLDPEYVKRERRLDLDKRAIAGKGVDVLTTLKDQGVQTEEARVLHAVLTGEDVADTDMAKLAVPIRQAIDELGQEAVPSGW